MVKLNPRVDVAFKKIFGVDENKDLLISLINSIVSKEDQVAELTLLNPCNQNNLSSTINVKANSVDGKRFSIEIRLKKNEANYEKLGLYYWAKLYTQQSLKYDYSALSKAICIHILNFTLPSFKKYHNVFHVVDMKSGIDLEDFELHTIELDKFTDNPN